MTGTDRKIIISGKIIFLLVLISIIPISFAAIGTNNAEHNLTEILHNNISVDFNRNDWVDEVDYTHEQDFIGIVSDLTCPGGVMMGVNENGPICFNLEKFYDEFNLDDQKCFSATKKCGGSCILDCTPPANVDTKEKPEDANSKDFEMVFGVQRGGCPSQAYIVCCEAVKPKTYDENYTQSGDCEDTDRDDGEPEEQIYTKGSVTLTGTNTTREDICVTENQIKEFFCTDTRMDNEIFTCNVGCNDGKCLK